MSDPNPDGTHRTERARLSAALGFGDGVTEPIATNAVIIEHVETLAAGAAEWDEHQRWVVTCALAGHDQTEDCTVHAPLCHPAHGHVPVPEPCICNTGPWSDGPDETCPRHGRPYSWWVEHANDMAMKLHELRLRQTDDADRPTREPGPDGWPCDRHEAHGPHPLQVAVPRLGQVDPDLVDAGEDCPGVRSHPATMIGRPHHPTAQVVDRLFDGTLVLGTPDPRTGWMRAALARPLVGLTFGALPPEHIGPRATDNEHPLQACRLGGVCDNPDHRYQPPSTTNPEESDNR